MDITIPISFVAGIASFFAPCVVPLLPAYLAYVAGVSLSELDHVKSRDYYKRVLITGIFYVLGFSLIFVLLGTAASGIGGFFRRYDLWVQKLGGLLILIFGLQYAGLFTIKPILKERKFNLPVWARQANYLRSFVLGMVFAAAWTPCVGAILGSILALAAIQRTMVEGATLLLFYSMGIALPFIIVSMTLASAPKYLNRLSKHLRFVSFVSGIILAFLGTLLLTGMFKYLNAWVFEIAFSLGYQIR